MSLPDDLHRDATRATAIPVAAELTQLRATLGLKRATRLSRPFLEDAIAARRLEATVEAVERNRPAGLAIPTAALVQSELARAIVSLSPPGDREAGRRLFLIAPHAADESAAAAREAVRGHMADSAWRQRVEPGLISKMAERIVDPDLRSGRSASGPQVPPRIEQVAKAPRANASTLHIATECVLAADGLPLEIHTTRTFRVEAKRLEYYPFRATKTGNPRYYVEAVSGATETAYVYDDAARGWRVHMLDLGTVLPRGAIRTLETVSYVVDVRDPPEPFMTILGEDNHDNGESAITLSFPAGFEPARIWRGAGPRDDFPHDPRESDVAPLPRSLSRYSKVTHSFRGPLAAGWMYGFWWTFE
jgi:hypothetical protein